MKIKKSISLALLSIIPLCGASDAADLEIGTTLGFESEYVFRGVQYADYSFQPAVDLTYGGMYFNFWSNTPITDPGNIFLTEINFVPGYTFSLNETVSLDVGLTYYYYPDAPSAEDDTQEIYLGIGHGISWLPSPTFYYDFDLDTFTFEITLGHSLPISGPDSPMTLDLGTHLGYVSPKGGDSGVYYGGTVDFSYAFSENASLSIGIRATGISDDLVGGGRDANVWWGMSFSAGF